MQVTEETTGAPENIAIIVAMTRDKVIGRQNALPWHIPEELQLFKCLTMGHPVIMGRKTFETIGRPLSGRVNIVLSRSCLFHKNIHCCVNLQEALETASAFDQTVFVIGGKDLYGHALPIATEMHISWIKKSYQGDVYFPEFNSTEWTCIEQSDYAEFIYMKYRRR